MTDVFRWLHLTDLHWGNDDHQDHWSTISRKLFADIRKLRQEDRCGGPFDAVFFTGDLVNRGKKAEYTDFNATLGEIWAVLTEDGSNPWFLPIPGNHDLIRPDPKGAELKALKQSRADGSAWEKLLKGQAAEHTKIFKDAFLEYEHWWKTLPSKFRKAEKWQAGLWPGEFAARLTKGSLNIGIVGLNTAFLHLEGNTKKGDLEIHPRQITAACTSDCEAWSRSNKINFLLTHHPPGWLSSQGNQSYEEIMARKHFAAHLFGHIHESKSIYFKVNGSRDAHNTCAALSLFGQKKNDGKTISRRYGYMAGVLKPTASGGEIRLWPRCAVVKEPAGFEIEKDPVWNDLESDEGSPSFDAITLEQTPMAKPWPMEKKPPPALSKPKTLVEEVVEKKNPNNKRQNGPTDRNEFRKKVKKEIKKLLNKGHFERDFAEILRNNQPTKVQVSTYLVDQLDLIEAMTHLSICIKDFVTDSTNTITLYLLADIELVVGWLAILGVNEKWLPAPGGTVELIPVEGLYSLEIVVSKVTGGPATFAYDQTTTGVLRGKGLFEAPFALFACPLPQDWANLFKANLWVALEPEEKETVFKRTAYGAVPKQFDDHLNGLLVNKIKIKSKLAEEATPYLLLNPNRESMDEFPRDVLKILQKDLTPLRLISFTTPNSDIWEEGIHEEALIEHIKLCYSRLQTGRQKLEG